VLEEIQSGQQGHIHAVSQVKAFSSYRGLTLADSVTVSGEFFGFVSLSAIRALVSSAAAVDVARVSSCLMGTACLKLCCN